MLPLGAVRRLTSSVSAGGASGLRQAGSNVPRIVRQRRSRFATTSTNPSVGASPASPLGIRVSTLFGALMIIGVGSTAYGLYEFYAAFTMWPKIIRDDLRAGVKAKHQGSLNTSERYLTRALETALTLPLNDLTPNPHAKLSGIAVVLGEVLEANGKPAEAYEVYAAALERLQNTIKQQQTLPVEVRVSGPERIRAAALAYKLGEMAEMYSQPAQEEEKWLVYAVEELLRVLRDTRSPVERRNVADEGGSSDGNPSLQLDDLELPAWIKRDDVVAPLERLGAFYSRTGKQEYAIPLYLHALSVLLPPNSQNAPPETKCQGAHIMNSLANSLSQTPGSERASQAETWVKKAIAVIDSAKASERDPEVIGQCEAVLVAALFNMGSLREMAGASAEAKEWYKSSHDKAVALRMREGILESEQALRRLNRLQASVTGVQNAS